MKTVGERIALLREQKDISQRKLMEELKISNLGRIEKGEYIPRIDIIIAISDYFAVTTDWLLKGVDYIDDVRKHHEELILNEAKSNYGTSFIDISEEDRSFLSKVNMLSGYERIKIEGIIDGMNISRELNAEEKARSSASTNGEEAATTDSA